MRRRDFIAGIAGSAAAWPLAVRAQQKTPTIGLLTAGTPSTHGQWVAAFVQRLGELGWIDGRNVAFEYRWAEGRSERYAEIGAELVRRKVDVIVTQGGVVAALQRVTSSVPIVFTVASDPLGSGFVTSLARPGGNVTGLSLQMTDLGGKRLQLLREAVPGLSRLEIMGDGGYPASVLEMDEIETAARALGLAAARFEIRGASDIGPNFERLKGNVQALYVVAAPLMTTNQIRINTLAAAAQLPTMHGVRDLVTTGGLMSYGANFPDLFGRAAGYVDKILRGAKPGDLPVEQPTKFDLVINQTTAKALGLKIPELFLLRADEVIE